MPYTMRVASNGLSIDGQWLASFDHEADDGRGYGLFTDDITQAMQFSTVAELMQFWNKQSVVRPLRPDGKPNKPLTALTIEVERAP